MNPVPQQIQQTTQPVPVNPPIRRLIVVKQLPVKEVREAELEDGSIADMVTIEEALSEILEAVRKE